MALTPMSRSSRSFFLGVSLLISGTAPAFPNEASGRMSPQQRMVQISSDPEIQSILRTLESRVEAQRKEQGIAGLSVAVVFDRELLWSKGFGYADLEKKVPAGPKTVYRVGSITKVFTATMLMQLRDEGKVRLDDPVESAVPAFRVRSAFPDARPPTFRQLVSHTAGLPKDGPFPSGILRGKTRSDEDQGVEAMLPGWTEFKYSNLGVAVMGHALARVAGRPYRSSVVDRILRPLEMNDSGFEPAGAAARMATGYMVGKDRPPQVVSPPAGPTMGEEMAPAGGLLSTVDDMARFLSLQFAEGPKSRRQILGGTTLREMHAPVFLDRTWKSAIAIGWWLDRIEDETMIWHGGQVTGFLTAIQAIPELKLGVAVFTNSAPADAPGIGRGILQALLPPIRRHLALEEVNPLDIPPADYPRYVGRYLLPGVAELVIKVVDGKLVAEAPGLPDPSTYRYIRLGPNRYQIKGGPLSGEVIFYEPDETGRIIRIHSGSAVFHRQ